jgi:hypothetical protein
MQVVAAPEVLSRHAGHLHGEISMVFLGEMMMEWM